MSLRQALVRLVPGGRAQSLLARAFPAAERRVARQSFWMGAMLVVHALGGLATMSLTARILGAEGLGVLAVIAAVTGLVYGLTSIPGASVVTTFVTRAMAEGRPEEGARVFRFALAASQGMALIAYAVIAVLALAAAGLLGLDTEHKNLILLYGVGGVLTATHGESMAALRLADRLQLHLLATVAGRLAGVGLLAAIWLLGGGLTEVVLANVAAAVVDGLGVFTAVVVSAPRAGLAGFLRAASLKVPPDVVRFQTSTFWQSSVTAVIDNMDVVLLAQFAGAADVGLYRAARRIVDMARRPIGLMPNAAQPEYSRQWYSGQGAELRRTTLRMTVWAFTLTAAGFGLLAAFREPIIRIILGDGFAGAAPLLLILLLGALPVAAAFRILPAAVGRVWPVLLSGTAGLAVFLAAMALLAPAYGPDGAAWARTLSALAGLAVVTPFTILVLRQSYRLRPPKRQGEAE